MKDIFDINYFPPSNAYKDYFGSWSNVIRAAGYIPPRSYTDEELLVILQKMSRKVDGSMRIKDYKSVRKFNHLSEACW